MLKNVFNFRHYTARDIVEKALQKSVHPALPNILQLKL